MTPLTLLTLVAVLASPQPGAIVDSLKAQVRLARAGFSTGEIDGRMGANTRRALAAYAQARGIRDEGLPAILDALGREQPGDPTSTYLVDEADVQGPYSPDIPSDLMEQAQLPALGYRSALEALAEKLHASPTLLRRLNPAARFAAGEEITAPNIPLSPAPAANGPVVVRVSKGDSSLRLEAPDGRLLFYAPVTTGSAQDPLPIGELKVTGINWNPQFHYNPDLFWDADPSHAKATIQPGPNNPVGVVWTDLDKPHYGLHGTPEPAKVGKTASHGCVRLTNWDAARVASLVRPGTRVVFEP